MKKKLIISTLIVSNLVTAGVVNFKTPKVNSNDITQEVEFNNNETIIKKAIIGNIKATGRIEVCQNSLSQQTVLSKNKNKKLFYNDLQLNFKGVCHNYIDLSKSEIVINNKQIIIVAKLEQEAEIISLNSETKKGILSLYTQKLKVEEVNNIEQEAKKKMIESSSTNENKDIIKNISEDKIEKIIDNLVKETYEVKIISFC